MKTSSRRTIVLSVLALFAVLAAGNTYRTWPAQVTAGSAIINDAPHLKGRPWQKNLPGGYGGTHHETTDGTATWSNELAGNRNYVLYATWQPRAGNPAPATFTAKVERNDYATVPVDLSQAPQGFSDQGVTWQEIGRRAATNSKWKKTFSVQLTGRQGVSADAIRYTICGNGIAEGLEKCDDGTANGQPGRCSADCTICLAAAACGPSTHPETENPGNATSCPITKCVADPASVIPTTSTDCPTTPRSFTRTLTRSGGTHKEAIANVNNAVKAESQARSGFCVAPCGVLLSVPTVTLYYTTVGGCSADYTCSARASYRADNVVCGK